MGQRKGQLGLKLKICAQPNIRSGSILFFDIEFAEDEIIIALNRKSVYMRKFQCRKVFALNINVFQEKSFLIYFDISPCFLHLGIT